MNIVAGALAGVGPGAGWRLGADEAAANHCVAHTLRADGFDASEDGTGRGTPLAVSYCLNAKGGGGRLDWESETLIPTTGVAFDVAPTITAQIGEQTGMDARNGNLIAFDTTQITSAANRSNPKPGDPCHPIAAGAHPPAVAFGWQNAAAQGMPVDTIAPTLDKSKHPATATATAVRRLMPVECERLQGFPDGYTAITYRGKPAADGPRYKALGNSWAIPPVRWIGMRIAMVDALHAAQLEAA